MSFIVEHGMSPVILAMPHVGTGIPGEIRDRLNDNGRLIADTDWHIERLYEGLLPGATTVQATFHRYVIDANRDPSGVSLYPGQNTTTLIPTSDFDNKPIWRAGEEPGKDDIAARIAAFHRPYHEAIEGEIARVKAMHGIAVLFDCHSIRSRIPFLFEGVLPDFNIGTNEGATCAPEVEAALAETAADAEGYTHVLNGRFKGGWTTRHYGQPKDGVHAIQLELAQSAYLASETLPFDYDAAKAERLRVHLKKALQRIEAYAFAAAAAGKTK